MIKNRTFQFLIATSYGTVAILNTYTLITDPTNVASVPQMIITTGN